MSKRHPAIIIYYPAAANHFFSLPRRTSQSLCLTASFIADLFGSSLLIEPFLNKSNNAENGEKIQNNSNQKWNNR